MMATFEKSIADCYHCGKELEYYGMPPGHLLYKSIIIPLCKECKKELEALSE